MSIADNIMKLVSDKDKPKEGEQPNEEGEQQEEEKEPKMTLANFKSDFLEFDLTREPTEIKKDTIDDRCRIFQMQDRARLLLNYNDELLNKADKLKAEREVKKKSDMEDIAIIVKSIGKNNEQIENLNLKTKEQMAQIKKMTEDHHEKQKELNTNFIVKVEEKNKEIAIRQESLEDIQDWLKHEMEKTDLRDQLREMQEAGVKKHQQEMDNIKKERALAIDKLRKEMLMKIRNVKNQMLSMNEDQLQGTTKLTVKQNLQLSSELEYQSQHIEQLTYQNDKMKQQMKLLKIELEEHSEVENELAKRSHFCNRVIQKYKAQIEVLREELHEKQNGPQQIEPEDYSQRQKKQNDFSKSDLTQFLQKRIMDYEMKQQQAQNQLEEIKSEYQKLFNKINKQKTKYKNTVYILSDFIDQLISQDASLVESQNNHSQPQVDIHLDLDLIKGAQDLEQDLDNKSLLALALVLLKQVQPYVTDFEAHESRFQQSMEIYQSQQSSVVKTFKNSIEGNERQSDNKYFSKDVQSIMENAGQISFDQNMNQSGEETQINNFIHQARNSNMKIGDNQSEYEQLFNDQFRSAGGNLPQSEIKINNYQSRESSIGQQIRGPNGLLVKSVQKSQLIHYGPGAMTANRSLQGPYASSTQGGTAKTSSLAALTKAGNEVQYSRLGNSYRNLSRGSQGSKNASNNYGINAADMSSKHLLRNVKLQKLNQRGQPVVTNQKGNRSSMSQYGNNKAEKLTHSLQNQQIWDSSHSMNEYRSIPTISKGMHLKNQLMNYNQQQQINQVNLQNNIMRAQLPNVQTNKERQFHSVQNLPNI